MKKTDVQAMCIQHIQVGLTECGRSIMKKTTMIELLYPSQTKKQYNVNRGTPLSTHSPFAFLADDSGV